MSRSKLRSKFQGSNSDSFMGLLDYCKNYFTSYDQEKIIEYSGNGSYFVVRRNEMKESTRLQLKVSKARKFSISNSQVTFEKASITTAEWCETYYYNRNNLIGATQYKVNAFQNLESE
ncbi:MAG: hypothetical protein QXU18_13295 [Thermoplasmatales archaeon]